MMQLDLYRVFYITALEQNLSKAAKKLYITQPSVSYAIKQLEERLETPLFIRTSKGVLLTKEGQVLFESIEPAFALIHKAEQRIAEFKHLKRGHVTIGGSDSTCKHYLLPYIQTFQDRYADIQIKLHHGSTPQIIEKLTNGLIDIGIVHLPIAENHVHVTDFLTISSTFVVGKKYKELANQTLSLEDILHYPLISFSESSSSRKFLEQLFRKQDLHVQPDIEVGSVELLKECAKIGMGIAFVTKELVQQELANEELFEVHVNVEIADRKVGLITQKNGPLSNAANKFFKHLNQNNTKFK
ncbi:LysR family transcriptional regulator [Alkalihalobacillus pseudalcaliphilus]|nr:LysR family transcriptional regulator [Alkalihalobacillus pseudalcaliphilus]